MKTIKQKITDHLNRVELLELNDEDVLISVIGNNVEITFKNEFNIEGLETYLLENIKDITSISTRLDGTMDICMK